MDAVNFRTRKYNSTLHFRDHYYIKNGKIWYIYKNNISRFVIKIMFSRSYVSNNFRISY